MGLTCYSSISVRSCSKLENTHIKNGVAYSTEFTNIVNNSQIQTHYIVISILIMLPAIFDNLTQFVNDCVIQTIAAIPISRIVGLSLTFASDTPWPLIFGMMNFTAVVQNGTPQRYEWTSSDGWTATSIEPYATHRYLEPGDHSMTVNASNSLGYRMASVNFTVHRRTKARVTYAQVPRTAVVGQTFVLSVSVESKTYSLLECSLLLDDKLIENVSDSDAIMHRHDHYVMSVTVEVSVDSGKHRVTLVATDIASGEVLTRVWYIDAFDAIAHVVIDLPTPAIATGSTTVFTVRHLGGSETVTYLWDFGDQSTTVETGVRPSSPPHKYTQPGSYIVRATATNEVSRVTGSATVDVVDAISGVKLAYDGPTTLGDDTFLKAMISNGTQVTYNFSAPDATILAKSGDVVMVKYSIAGRHEVNVLVHNAVSNGSASLTIYVVDASTLFVRDVGNATCGLPLHSVVTFHADVVCANISFVMFHWSIPEVLNSSGRGLSIAMANFAAPGVYQLTLTVWNDDVGVRSEYNRKLCVNESLPGESSDLQELSIGISRIGAPYLPAEDDIAFFPIIFHCSFICSFRWQFWDSIPPTQVQGFKVRHAFRKTGVFNVSLAVHRLLVQKTIYTAVVVNKRIEKAFLQAAVKASNVNEPIEFTVVAEPDETETGNLTYCWWFDDDLNARYDGNSSTMTYAFHGDGTRHITVTVYNSVSTVTVNTSVNVYGKITGLGFTGCCGRTFNTTVQFQAFVETGQISSYRWTLRNDNGLVLTSSVEQVFVYTFASAGYYRVQLTAENPLSNQTVIDYFSIQVSCMTILQTPR